MEYIFIIMLLFWWFLFWLHIKVILSISVVNSVVNSGVEYGET